METCYADTPKIKGKPFVKQVGEDRLERGEAGNVTMAYGYYSPTQVLSRKVWAKAIYEKYKRERHSIFSKEVDVQQGAGRRTT